MMLDDLKKIARENASAGNRGYLLNLLKEEMQNYILNFVYTRSRYKELIFTGGTCLRKIFGLNRLSADLDFDFEEKFDQSVFADELTGWFEREHQLRGVEIAGRKQSIRVKLTGTEESLPHAGKGVLFVTVDVSPVMSRHYEVEHNLLSTPALSLIVRNYSLATLFAKKIAAFLTRDYRFGKGQEVSFKARDLYDIYWLCQRSKQTGYALKPNFKVLAEEVSGKNPKEVFRDVLEKLKLIDDGAVKTQLTPFFPDANFVADFALTCGSSIKTDMKNLLNR